MAVRVGVGNILFKVSNLTSSIRNKLSFLIETFKSIKSIVICILLQVGRLLLFIFSSLLRDMLKMWQALGMIVIFLLK